jgi:glycine cleavage system regulatory protein
MDLSLVLTVIGEDRPGLIERLSSAIEEHGGNWLESRMSHLAGKFAGIVRVQVAREQVEPLRAALASLEGEGLSVAAETSEIPPQAAAAGFHLDLVGPDQPGIVHDLSRALARRGVNVEELETECSSAPMSAEPLFRATARLHLPEDLDPEDLRADLEQIAHSLIADISLVEEG